MKMNEIPSSPNEQMLPYIKKRRSPLAKIVLLMSVAAIVIGCGVTLANKLGGENFFSKLFGAAKATSSSATKSTETTAEKNIYDFDVSSVPKGQHGIIPADLSCAAVGYDYVGGDGNIAVSADTSFTFQNGKIQVLIVNTHPYEAYTDEISASYGDDFSAVGGDKTVKELAQSMTLALAEKGIGTEYLDTGVTSNKNSYAEAKKKISEYLKDHTDILYIIDIHRDVLTDGGENLLRPITKHGDVVCAQMNFTVSKSAKNYESNLLLAAALAEKIKQISPSVLMPTEITGSVQNQDLAKAVVTLNIGTCGNSFSEASESAKLFTEALAFLAAGEER